MTVVQLDVSSDASVNAAVETVKAALGGEALTGLINNAGGIAGEGGMGFSTAEHWHGTMELNYTSSAVRATLASQYVLGRHRVWGFDGSTSPGCSDRCD